MLNNQAVQVAELIPKLSNEDRYGVVQAAEKAMEQDLEFLLSRTKRAARCWICKVPFVKTAYDSMVALHTQDRKCGHLFHVGCVMDQVSRSQTCPVCHCTPVYPFTLTACFKSV